MKMKKKDHRTTWEREIDHLLSEMEQEDPRSKSYKDMATNFESLTRHADYDHRSKNSRKISPEVKLSISVGAILTLITLFRSDFNIVDSNVWKFIPKIGPRI